MPWRPSPPKIQGCRIDQQIQRWLKDQLQDSIANKGMAWPSRHATSKLDDSIQILTMASKAHTKSNFSRIPAMFKEPLQLNSH